MIRIPAIRRIDDYIDSDVYRFINKVSDLNEEVRSRRYMKGAIPSKLIGFVGDWGVGKDSLALKILELDVPIPKLETDHAKIRRRHTRDIAGLCADPDFDLVIRIIPGSYEFRQRDEEFFKYIYKRYHVFNAFAFCYAVNSRTSLENLKNKWVPMTKKALGEKRMPPFIFVGTKSDLEEVVTDLSARRLHFALEGMGYYKCSVYNDRSIDQVRDRLNSLTMRAEPSISFNPLYQ